jgi:hypothetical protein
MGGSIEKVSNAHLYLKIITSPEIITFVSSKEWNDIIESIWAWKLQQIITAESLMLEQHGRFLDPNKMSDIEFVKNTQAFHDNFKHINIGMHAIYIIDKLIVHFKYLLMHWNRFKKAYDEIQRLQKESPYLI